MYNIPSGVMNDIMSLLLCPILLQSYEPLLAHGGVNDNLSRAVVEPCRKIIEVVIEKIIEIVIE